MTDQEWAEAEAKALLPNVVTWGFPDDYRPAVAQALLALKVENAKLQAVFDSLAPTNSKAYEGLLATGQVLINKDAKIAELLSRLETQPKGLQP